MCPGRTRTFTHGLIRIGTLQRSPWKLGVNRKEKPHLLEGKDKEFCHPIYPSDGDP
eukprot:gene11959-biopygen16175